MRLVFMGTPDFAVPSLKALAGGGHQVVGVFTQPDRPSGRGKQMKPSPVKTAALELGLPVFQPERVKAPEAVAELRRLAPECIVVVAYGQILSPEILTLPPKGCINVHASLLPNYRGAAPIHWAVIKGEKVTGVTTMRMDEGLDTGDMLLKAEYPISAKATTGEVHDALAELGGKLILVTLSGLAKGEIRQIPQEGPSNYAPLLTREHEQIDWGASAWKIHNLIRGLNPWPGAYTTFRGEPVKIWQSSLPEGENAGEIRTSGLGLRTSIPLGEVVRVLEDGLLVGSGDGFIKIREMQPAGKRRMPAREFFLGRHGEAGERLG